MRERREQQDEECARARPVKAVVCADENAMAQPRSVVLSFEYGSNSALSALPRMTYAPVSGRMTSIIILNMRSPMSSARFAPQAEPKKREGDAEYRLLPRDKAALLCIARS